jgi:hypothetical protein
MKCCFGSIVTGLVLLSLLGAQAAPPDEKAPAKSVTLPHLEFNLKTKQIRVEAEMLAVEMPLEFFAVVLNGPEHEAVIRSKVKPSDLHTALLAVGLKPGAPISWSKAANKWIPPHGPPLQVQMEYEKNGKLVSEPATRWMRNVKTKKEMPITTWIFAGSRVMNDGNYAADSTGYLVSVVNFDMTVIDIPDLASASNESLEWERNPETAPPAGTKVTMVIEPAGKLAGKNTPTTAPTQPATLETQDSGLSDVQLDEALIARATKKWNDLVGPKAAALREAAQAHYDAISALRKEQQRLIDEADRLQRAIDQLERQYQDMTTPQPDLGEQTEEAPEENAGPKDESAP